MTRDDTFAREYIPCIDDESSPLPYYQMIEITSANEALAI